MKPIAKEDRELNHLEGLHYAQDPWLAAHAKASRGEAISKQEVTGPFNLGNPTEFSILEMAQTIIGLTCSRSKIVHLPLLPEDDPKQRCTDISAAEHSLDWKPAVSLEEGLARTIKYFEEDPRIGKTQTGHRMSITANVGLTEGPR